MGNRRITPNKTLQPVGPRMFAQVQRRAATDDGRHFRSICHAIVLSIRLVPGPQVDVAAAKRRIGAEAPRQRNEPKHDGDAFSWAARPKP